MSSSAHLRAFGRAGRRDVFLAETLIEYGGDVLERCHRNLDVAAQHDRRGAHRCGIAGVGDRQHHLAIGRPERKHHHLAQEPPGELFHQRCRRQQVRQRDAGGLEELSDFVGEVIGRQVGQFPQFVQSPLIRSRCGAVAQGNFAGKEILAPEIVGKLVRNIESHSTPQRTI